MAQRYVVMFSFQTPLQLAISNQNKDVVEILLRNGANPNQAPVRITSLEEQRNKREYKREREKERERRREKRESARSRKHAFLRLNLELIMLF
jgi:ankyrin repeat protein